MEYILRVISDILLLTLQITFTNKSSIVLDRVYPRFVEKKKKKEKMASKETTVRSVLCPGGRLPDWMTGPDSSSESSDDEEDGAGALPYWLRDSNKNYSKARGEEENDPPPPPPPEIISVSSPPADEEENHGDSGVEEESSDVGWVNQHC